MTEQNLKRSFPLIRSGVLFASLFALAAYAGSRISSVISPDRISCTEAFNNCSGFAGFTASWIQLVLPCLIGFILIFLSAFSPFCPLVCSVVTARCAFICGLMLPLVNDRSAALFVSALFAALATAVFSALSSVRFSKLRRFSFKRNDPVFPFAVGYLTEFLLISGVSSFIYLIAALVSRFL